MMLMRKVCCYLQLGAASSYLDDEEHIIFALYIHEAMGSHRVNHIQWMSEGSMLMLSQNAHTGHVMVWGLLPTHDIEDLGQEVKPHKAKQSEIDKAESN